ncbi:ABC transporter ATP-binding protein [Sneathiella marina]|uniref:ABC transporter ATP-binding protein n=1 Tax=Sneathiella marina TaxID=2950108 RepID=A0ABY4VY68_9PROT|nr:ABC transporter ATP-binding protein [Sneathiella marina]USG59694.1 ABC transporter ATP-binding protein [Sneathiella marina]
MASDNTKNILPAKGSVVRAANQAIEPVGLDLKLTNLVFGEIQVLSDLRLSLKPGKVTCLLGPSGVGKSSILKIIAGFIPLPAGSLLTSNDNTPLSNRISFMDQKDLLLPWASVIENVVIGARLRGESPDFEQARAILTHVGLEDRETARPDTLSGGMRQRVALVRTLMDNCPIVLMDEPFSALDAITKFRLQGLAADLLREKTVLLITHDPMEALRLGDVIHVLSGSPVALSPEIVPEGKIPRDPADETLKHQYSEIMRQLALTESEVI